MLIWGSGNTGIRVCANGQRECPSCKEEKPYSIYLNYSYAHLYYLFSWITKREYISACDTCRRGKVVTRDDVKALTAVDPVPWIRRSGWMLGAGLIGACLLFAAVLPAITANAQRVHVGDVYECQFDVREGGGNRYGLLRVQAVEGDRVVMVPSKEMYADRKSADAAFEARRWKEPNYLDAVHAFRITALELDKFAKSGKVFVIWRED
jgi:hypothetical protein